MVKMSSTVWVFVWQEIYGDFALFFYDKYGGKYIAVLWKPTAFTPKDFKVSDQICLIYILCKKVSWLYMCTYLCVHEQCTYLSICKCMHCTGSKTIYIWSCVFLLMSCILQYLIVIITFLLYVYWLALCTLYDLVDIVAGVPFGGEKSEDDGIGW